MSAEPTEPGLGPNGDEGPAFDLIVGRYREPVFEVINEDLDVVYAHANLTMNVYSPDDDPYPTRPVVILAHGGFFIFGSKADFDSTCRDFAHRGYICATIDYRKIPASFSISEAQFKEGAIQAIADMRAAVRYFHRDASDWNYFKADTQNIYVGGYSAGALMALHVAFLDQESEIPQELSSAFDDNGGLFGDSGNAGYSNAVAGAISLAGALFNAQLIDTDDPPLLSVHGDADPTVPYGAGFARDPNGNAIMMMDGPEVLHARLDTLEIENELLTLVGAQHGAPVSEANRETVDAAILNFLATIIEAL